MPDTEKAFLHYAEPYRVHGEKIQLKIDHTLRVRELCLDLAARQALSGEETALAAACGLLHDVGRFEQWRRYGTYNDAKSIDHGDLGARIVEREDRLTEGFGAGERGILLSAVRYHNKYCIPGDLDAKSSFFTRLTRDADKLDILYLLSIGELQNLSHGSALSPAVYEALREERPMRKEDIRTKADRFAIYLGFVFDLNFKKSFQIVTERDYLNAMIDRQLRESTNTELESQLEALRKRLTVFLSEKAEG